MMTLNEYLCGLYAVEALFAFRCWRFAKGEKRKANSDQRFPVLTNYFLTPAGSIFKPASAASLAALSVFSQVKSASLRPKCP